MTRLLKGGWIAAFAGAALAWPVGALIAATSVEAWRITPHPPHLIEGKRAEFEFDAPDKNAPDYSSRVAGIYGTTTTQPARFVFVSKDRLLRPREKPDLVLLPVEKGERPIEVAMVRFIRKWVQIGATAAGTVLLALWGVLRRKRPAIP